MSNIKTGFWIDWEHGAVQGSTLTLPTYYGLILVSFLTLFVQFSGASLWRALCFFLHRRRSTLAARDGLYHQQQIILRNAASAPGCLWSLFRSAVVWKDKVDAALTRSFPLMLIASTHIGCFITAGLFSSQIASTKTGQALVKSDICGYPKKLASVKTAYRLSNLTDDQVPIFNTQVLLGRYTVNKAAAYVRACYNDVEGNVDCNHFVRRNLVSTGFSESQVACPFGDLACKVPAIRFDSGLIKSNEDLGINSPTSESLSFRRVTTCAPVDAEKYATPWQPNLTEAFAAGATTTTNVKFYEFGKSNADTGCMARVTTQTTNSTTFCVSEWMKAHPTGAYLVTASTAYADQANFSDFSPILGFKVDKADVSLLSIFNRAIYTAKVDDPLFNARNASKQNSEFFSATDDLAVLGCLEQYQFCNPRSGKCTDLDGLYAVRSTVKKGELALSPRQEATFNMMWEAGWAMAIQWTSKLMNSRMLLAQDWVFTTTSTGSGPLPPNQWELESENLHNLSLAVFQHRLNQYAAPETFQLSPNMNAADHLDIPQDPESEKLCHSQRVLSSTYYSVSVLGMAIILCVGSCFVILDQLHEKIWFDYLNPKSKIAKQAEWTQTSTLQLHRQALEARGIGPWDRKNMDYPVLETHGAAFSGLGAREEKIGEMNGDDGEKKNYSLVSGEIPMDDHRDSQPR